MDYIFDHVMHEIETILVTSPHSRSHFEKDNNIFIRVKEIAFENGLEPQIGKLFWKYIRVLHKDWIQASFKDQKNAEYQYKVRLKLHKMIWKFGEENGFETKITTHLLCLHEAIWHSLMNQLQAYFVKMNYINSHFTDFKNHFVL